MDPEKDFGNDNDSDADNDIAWDEDFFLQLSASSSTSVKNEENKITHPLAPMVNEELDFFNFKPIDTSDHQARNIWLNLLKYYDPPLAEEQFKRWNNDWQFLTHDQKYNIIFFLRTSLSFIELNHPMPSNLHLIHNQIFLGNLETALYETKRLQLTHIVSIIHPIQMPVISSEIKHLKISLEDTHQSNIIRYFPQTYDFISNAILENSKNNILVHCHMGISRSTTLLLAFFMKHLKLNLLDAYLKIQERRKQICPNDGFVHQLQLWEFYLFKSPICFNNSKIETLVFEYLF